MKNKYGFTLVELLAVIVVLAIIASIAAPSILSVIDKAKKGSLKNSAGWVIPTILVDGNLSYAFRHCISNTSLQEAFSDELH